jgi:glutamate/tyrosine decarboxylase-like PLP-dependent enzyme
MYFTLFSFPGTPWDAFTRYVETNASVRTCARAEPLRHPHGGWWCTASQEVYSSTRKAIELLGIGSDHARTIRVDESDRMRVPELAAALQRDVAEGDVPMAVVASAWTSTPGPSIH